jgi:hypothetical protein
MTMNKKSISRRRFFGRVTAAGAALATPWPLRHGIAQEAPDDLKAGRSRW